MAADDVDEEVQLQSREAPPLHFLFKIESFSLLSEYGIKKYESREFDAGGYKWRLIIFPNGDKAGQDADHVSARLAVADMSSLPENWGIKALFSFFCLNQISGDYVFTQEWGFSKFLSQRTFTNPSNGYLVDDCCVFGAEISVIKDESEGPVMERLSLQQKVANPHKHEFKISNFSNLENVWTSQEFTAANHKWKIYVYPKGDGISVGRSVSVFLRYVRCGTNSAPYRKLLTKFSICMKNQINNHHKSKTSHDWFSSAEDNWGWGDFISLDDVSDSNKGFIIHDCCILEIEISVEAVASGFR